MSNLLNKPPRQLSDVNRSAANSFTEGEMMLMLTRRGAIVTSIAAGLAFAGHMAPADDGDPAKMLSAEQILRDRVSGAVRVKLEVEGWVKLEGPVILNEHQHLALQRATFGSERLSVLVAPKVIDRLRALGIADPREHVVGKTVVVTGTVDRTPAPAGGTFIILMVNELAQVESITNE